MDILKRINSLRLDRGWSVYKLAVEADIPQSTIINMFNRETLPSIVTLEKICEAFGITMSEFFSPDNKEQDITDNEILTLYHSLTKEQAKIIYDAMREFSSK